jgi:hypothetical protein
MSLWKGWWQNMDELMELKDALKQMEVDNQIPDGFLYRIIVLAGTDLQPFSTSLYGLTASHGMELNHATANKGDNTYDIFDLVGFVDFDSMERMMKETDAIIGQIIKQSKEEGFINSVSLAVHFVNKPVIEEE